VPQAKLFIPGSTHPGLFLLLLCQKTGSRSSCDTYVVSLACVGWLQSVNFADTVRECLEKQPSERTEDDVETILNAIQHLQVSMSAVFIFGDTVIICHTLMVKTEKLKTAGVEPH